MMTTDFTPLIFWAVTGIILLSGLRIANQYERAVVFRLGKYQRTAGPGLYYLIPIVDRGQTVDLRTMTTEVAQQEAITKDNVPVKINAVIWRRTIDPKSAVIEVMHVGEAVVQVAVTSLRGVIGQHTLDDVLKEQEAISAALQASIDRVTEPWGVRVERVQMRNVEIPESMQRAMAQEAEALREKRARKIKAEAEVEAAALLRQASEIIMHSPAGLELRRMQMITEVGAEQNTMTIIMMPSEFVEMARVVARKTD
jgi:regulator of protease activity HflC (stomatin/prohibitin superfamily)